MKIAIKNSSLFLLFLCFVISLKGQMFSFIDTIPTNISSIKYEFLPIQSEENFNYLLFSTEKEKQNFELLTIKNNTISNRGRLKNLKLDGGGDWYLSAAMSDKQLLLLHVDGFLVVYTKDKKGNYVLNDVVNIRQQTGRDFNIVSSLDDENIILMNAYNFYTDKKLYDNYTICIYNLRTKEPIRQIEIDLGRGILFSHFASTILMESKKNKIALEIGRALV